MLYLYDEETFKLWEYDVEGEQMGEIINYDIVDEELFGNKMQHSFVLMRGQSYNNTAVKVYNGPFSYDEHNVVYSPTKEDIVDYYTGIMDKMAVDVMRVQAQLRNLVRIKS